jgi:hypothetical protein
MMKSQKHKQKTWSMWKSLIYVKRRKERCREVILGQKWPKITLINNGEKKY